MDEKLNENWTGRSQALLEIIREPMRDMIPEGVTPVGLIRLLHEENVPGLRNFLAFTPGFNHDSSSQGLYHYTLLKQLEHVCNGFKSAYASGLIK